jgi:hypothetical protein
MYAWHITKQNIQKKEWKHMYMLNFRVEYMYKKLVGLGICGGLRLK